MNELQKNISMLEGKYMKVLTDIFQSNDFINSIKLIESNIQNDYEYLENYWQIKNKIKVGLERLTRFYIYKEDISIGTYHSPISSDIAFYTEDALILLDAKTIDLDGNSGDERYIQFERNQVSIINKSRHVYEPSNGVHYKSSIPTIDSHTGKPILTYFLCLVYKDNNLSFEAKRMSLACVPNGELSSIYNYDLIYSYKTYHYLNKTQALKLEAITGLINLLPFSDLQDHWIALPDNYFYDPNTIHPYYLDEKVLRRYIDKQYKIVLSGDNARILPSTIKERANGSSKWLGYKEWNL